MVTSARLDALRSWASRLRLAISTSHTKGGRLRPKGNAHLILVNRRIARESSTSYVASLGYIAKATQVSGD